MNNTKDVMVEIRIKLLRDGTLKSQFGYPTEAIAVPSTLILGMLSSTSQGLYMDTVQEGAAS